MSLHSYSRCWLHLIWGTFNREKSLHKDARENLSQYLYGYAKEKNIYMKINYVNADHVHTLIDLPKKYSIEEIAKLFKGSSSNWINKGDLLKTKFYWARGYAAFSVSQSNVEKLTNYIAGQEEHHKIRTFTQEYKEFIEKYGLIINR